MRKNNTAIIFGSLFFSCSVMAANGTLAPTVVPMVNGGQASIAISNTSPNLFTVPGDRIIAVNSLDGAGMPGNSVLNAAVSYGIVRLNAPVTVAFNMKQTVDAFFDSASQKQLSEAQSKALSARFNTALEASLQAWQQKHHAVILVSPAVVQGAPDITREIQQDIARRMRAEP